MAAAATAISADLQPETGVTLNDTPENGSSHQLNVTCPDRDGLLADLSEHIRACGVDIVSASVATDTSSGLVVDSFVVRGLSLACSEQRAV